MKELGLKRGLNTHIMKQLGLKRGLNTHIMKQLGLKDKDKERDSEREGMQCIKK